jgi:hypothetical protein
MQSALHPILITSNMYFYDLSPNTRPCNERIIALKQTDGEIIRPKNGLYNRNIFMLVDSSNCSDTLCFAGIAKQADLLCWLEKKP